MAELNFTPYGHYLMHSRPRVYNVVKQEDPLC